MDGRRYLFVLAPPTMWRKWSERDNEEATVCFPVTSAMLGVNRTGSPPHEWSIPDDGVARPSDAVGPSCLELAPARPLRVWRPGAQAFAASVDI